MEAGRTDKVSVFASVALHCVLLLGLVLGLGGAGTAPGEARDHIVVKLGVDKGAPARAPIRPAAPVTAPTVKKVSPEKTEVEPSLTPLKEAQPEPVPAEPEEPAVEVIEASVVVPVSGDLQELSSVDTTQAQNDNGIELNSEPQTSGNLLTGAELAGSGMDASPGEEEAAQRRELHLTEIRTSIQDSVVYPVLARKRGLEGEVLASFLVGPDGMPHDVQVLRSSGYRVFDREVVRVIHASSPYPAVDVVVEVPVLFRLAEKQK